MAGLTLPDGLMDPTVAPVAGLAATPFTTPDGNSVSPSSSSPPR